MELTWLDSNSWLIEMAGQRILLDPWLVGSLVFGNQPWLFQGSRPQPRAIPDDIDLILLSQGLEDHAHPATLAQLDRAIPVVASASAAKVVKALGFTQITSLAHGEMVEVGDRLQIQAFPGAPIGPLLTENGYVLKDQQEATSLYYEPHGFPAAELKAIAPVDVVITPIVSLTLPLLGALIQGHKTALSLVETLHPQFLLPTAAGGEVTFEGFLLALLKPEGSVEEFRSRLHQHYPATQLLTPKPGDRIHLPVKLRSAQGG